MTDVPIEEQIAAVQREIGMRERVYPRWVAAERMTQRKADAEIAAMRAVLATLRDVQKRRDDGTAERDAARAAQCPMNDAACAELRRRGQTIFDVIGDQSRVISAASREQQTTDDDGK